MSRSAGESGGRARKRGLLTITSVALCAIGIVTMAYGLAVPVKASIAQYRLERQFEEELALATPTSTAAAPSPLVTASSRPFAKKVASAPARLPQNGPVARISVKRLDVKEIVLAGEPTHERLARAPTMLKHGDAENPVTILAAHRDTHFRFIRDLQKGDDIGLQMVTGETRHYRITHFETVRWDEFTYPLDPARPLLVLTTCYPFDGTEYGGPLRRVAWAEQIS